MSPTRTLRSDWPFRRPAVVLSGGGALGAYEVGVLRVLEAVGFRPAIVAGVSVGAINAVVWQAHARGTAALESAWRRMGPADVGFRWVTLVLRALGGLVAALGAIELLLTLAGSRELSGAFWFWKRGSARLDLASTLLDLWMWGLFALAGILAVALSRRVESWLARRRPGPEPGRTSRAFGRVLMGLWLLYAVVWVFGLPWPHRFTVSALLVTTVVWLANRPGRSSGWARLLLHGLMAETRGRGLWSGEARRRLVEQLVAAGAPARLVDPEVRLVIGALAIDSGRICHFVAGPRPSDEFVRRLERELGEVVTVREPAEVVRAALASSAIPGVFEPERIGERDFVDPVGFANQPLHVALAAEADAAVVVLLSPSGRPSPAPPPPSLFALGSRLVEIANWRDMQAELRSLPEGWSPRREPGAGVRGGAGLRAPRRRPRLRRGACRVAHSPWRGGRLGGAGARRLAGAGGAVSGAGLWHFAPSSIVRP